MAVNKYLFCDFGDRLGQTSPKLEALLCGDYNMFLPLELGISWADFTGGVGVLFGRGSECPIYDFGNGYGADIATDRKFY